jgi:hypothetical protein
MEGLYKHKKSGNLYQLVDEAKLKDGDKWVDCVIYVSMLTGKSDVYVRKKEDFENKFIREK